ncbi:uncharacterized protein VTP21DRAFT_6843 [Calcarisporiella thermophila]|uniref:uncharacterized protein n=1 Tax=Calcarisporiella thermophila TaxID=911321 RepID=UPI0037440572
MDHEYVNSFINFDTSQDDSFMDADPGDSDSVSTLFPTYLATDTTDNLDVKAEENDSCLAIPSDLLPPLTSIELPAMTIAPAALHASSNEDIEKQENEEESVVKCEKMSDMSSFLKMVDERIANVLVKQGNNNSNNSLKSATSGTKKSSKSTQSSPSSTSSTPSASTGKDAIKSEGTAKTKLVYDDMPTPDEIKQMSSKEKRQLRNKISARNFRVRRKEYIMSLEDQIQKYKEEADSLRTSLEEALEENSKLREEIRTLRSNIPTSPEEQPQQQTVRPPTPTELPRSPRCVADVKEENSRTEKWNTRILVHRAHEPVWEGVWQGILDYNVATGGKKTRDASSPYGLIDMRLVEDRVGLLVGAIVWEFMHGKSIHE